MVSPLFLSDRNIPIYNNGRKSIPGYICNCSWKEKWGNLRENGFASCWQQELQLAL